MRKRINTGRKLVSSTRIPEFCIGELAKANKKFKETVKVKDKKDLISLKEFALSK